MHILTYMHADMYIHAHYCKYIRTYIYIHTHKHTHMYLHTYLHTNIHTDIHMSHTYIHTYIHTYMHTCIYTYIHAISSKFMKCLSIKVLTQVIATGRIREHVIIVINHIKGHDIIHLRSLLFVRL